MNERRNVDANGLDVEPFRVTPGFIAFVTALLLPALVAVIVYLGAWLVAGEVYAAERAPSSVEFSAGETEVAGWKKALVGICPAH